MWRDGTSFMLDGGYKLNFVKIHLKKKSAETFKKICEGKQRHVRKLTGSVWMSVDERRVSMLQVGEYEGGGRLRTFLVILSRRVRWEKDKGMK